MSTREQDLGGSSARRRRPPWCRWQVCVGKECCVGGRHCEVKLSFGGGLDVLDKQVSRRDMASSADQCDEPSKSPSLCKMRTRYVATTSHIVAQV